jgi:hypothetical protein
MKKRKIVFAGSLLSAAFACLLLSVSAFADDEGSLLKRLGNTPSQLALTVPSNGDVNPYGVALVKRSVGNLKRGHILVSNFNAASNQQGTGTTIMDVSPSGAVSQFAQINADTLPGPCPGGVGLTTALAVLRTGWVIVGSLPTTNGSSAPPQAGCLIVLDSMGNTVETFYGSLINGPWDMAARDTDSSAVLFVTNVLNGTVAAMGNVVNQGTVVRFNLSVSTSQMPAIESMTVIGSGFGERTDINALVIGPTGLDLSPVCEANDEDDCAIRGEEGERVLYVADSVNNRITVIPDPLTRTTSAGTGKVLTSGGSLNDPLGLVVAPNGHILTVNGDDGYIIEITPRGTQLAKKLLDNTGGPPPGNGTLFGVIFDPELGIVFVDDGSNTLNVLQ